MNERDIFAAARQLPDAAERDAFLDEACFGDQHLRGHIVGLLDEYGQLGTFLEHRNLLPVTDVDPATERPGTIIGPYKLLEKIGEGGMGTVWMAQQTEPVKRLVAVKLVKDVMDSRHLIARFQAERQALAVMDHANIARVLDGGTTATGRPYFVMDLVKGVPIAKYCDEHQLTPRQRLELFVPVCQAVQHAHQKGVIHRDIKPSNVLIALYDGKPVPKVIDFGVAKGAGQQLTEKTLVTGFGAVVGTLEYMSPEQAQLNNHDIDTRSDIYSLGVLLYELLTGNTPLERTRVKKSGMLEALRIIREEDAPTLSTRLATTEELPAIAANRGLEPAKLTKLVRGELDWIVMKALEKDRNHRYETANAFAADVQRYLHDEPVDASPRSRLYRLRKFLRRNKAPAMAASLALLSLIAGITGTTWGLLHADRNRRHAESALAQETQARQGEKQARERAMAALRSMTDEIVQNQMARETELRAEDREFLRQTLRHFEGFASITANDAESRAIRAEGYAQVGMIRHRLGELEDAEAALAEAELLWRELVAESPEQLKFRRELAHSQTNLGVLFRAISQLRKADASFAEAVANYTQLAKAWPDRPEFRQYLAQCRNNQGNLFSAMGRHGEAESAYADALASERQLVAGFPDRPNYRRFLAQTHSNLGILLRGTGRLKEAESAFAEALAIQRKLASEFPGRPGYQQELAGSYINMGVLLRATSRWKEAEGAYGQARALYGQLVADFPALPDARNQLALCENAIARLYASTGRTSEAEAASRAAIAIHRRLATDFPASAEFRLQLARSLNNFGSMLKAGERSAEAEAVHTEALTITRQLVADHPTLPEFRQELATSHNNLGVVFRVTGRLAEAQAAYSDALTIKKQLHAEFPTQPDLQQTLAGTLGNLAIVCDQRGDFVGAKKHLDEALPHSRAALKANPRNPEYRQLYRNNLRALTSANAWLNDSAGAIRAVQDIQSLGWDLSIDTYHAARSLARCIPIAQELRQLDAAQRQEAMQVYADRAMALLREAVVNGWKDADQMKKDTDLDALRQREDFEQLLKTLEPEPREPKQP